MNRVIVGFLCLVFALSTIGAQDSQEDRKTAIEGWVGVLDQIDGPNDALNRFILDNGSQYAISVGGKTSTVQSFGKLVSQNARIRVFGTLWEGPGVYKGPFIDVKTYTVIEKSTKIYKNFVVGCDTACSSYLIDPKIHKDFRYFERRALDGNLETTWVEGAKGDGIDEWIRLGFYREIVIDKILISIGFDKNDKLFAANNRVKKLNISDDSNKKFNTTHEFEDRRGLQEIRFDPPVNVKSLTFTIKSVFPGNTFQDTCIAEIEVWGTYKR